MQEVPIPYDTACCRIRGKDAHVSKELLIAVVEDDESFRMALAESLRSLGYGAREFASAEEFIASDGERLCDCVITDIQMPGMGGLKLSRLLASRPSPIPVIMITALAKPGLESQALANGSSCMLRKPFKADALVACLQKALQT